jgi:hypothetical protein
MTNEELEVRCIKLFGKKHWKKILAEKSGRDFTTVRRWRRSVHPVPRFVEILLDTIEQQRRLERITSSLTKQLK